MKLPKPVGEPTPLFPMRWYKTALLQEFENPRTGKREEFNLFHSPNVFQVTLGVTKNAHIIVAHQFRYGISIFQKFHNASPFILELPGGGQDKGESWEKAARREFLEETGYEPATFKSLVHRRRLWMDPAASTMQCSPWLAMGCKKVGDPQHGDTEFIKVKLIPVKDWYGMIYAGKVVDCRSIAVSLLALPHLQKAGFI